MMENNTTIKVQTDDTEKRYKSGKIREQNYQIILDAAEIIFAQYGYKGASMMAIAKAAKLPKANIHYYFKSKSLLYTSVLERIIYKWNSGLETISVNDDPAVVLTSYIYSKVKLACEKPLPSKLFATEIISGAPYVNDFIKTDMRLWVQQKADIFKQWIAMGKMNDIDPIRLIFMIWSTTQHYADFKTQVMLITDRDNYDDNDVNEIAAFITHMVLSACGIAAAPSHPSINPTNE